jgi:hypothetical protein
MLVTNEQKRFLDENGYLKLPGIIPRETVLAALKGINVSIGQNGIDPARLTEFRAQTFCPEIRSEAFISDLFNATPLRQVADELIGEGNIRPAGGGQIALRFPSSAEARVFGPHIDGTYSPTNGVKEGTLGSFTALAGVFLSDVTQPLSGNFAVWPGGHKIVEQYARDNGPQSLVGGLKGIEFGEPEQILANAGDAVIAHYMLPHSVTGNQSPFPRYAIFFRLKHVKHEEWKWECLTDIWREWEGMRSLAAS